jgi:hypothetical protein
VAVAPSGTPDGWRREHATPSGGRTGAERNSRVSRRMFDANANLRPLPVWFRAAVPARRETLCRLAAGRPLELRVLAPSTEKLGYQLLRACRAKLLLISGPTLFRVQAESDAAGIRCATVASCQRGLEMQTVKHLALLTIVSLRPLLPGSAQVKLTQYAQTKGSASNR